MIIIILKTQKGTTSINCERKVKCMQTYICDDGINIEPIVFIQLH
jgi:hypothetical protein